VGSDGAAEAALAEFAGTRGHAKAKEAADILNKFINNATAWAVAPAKGCDFIRVWGSGMGNTIAQLLAGMSSGSGSGGMSGDGAVGLYGGLPPCSETWASLATVRAAGIVAESASRAAPIRMSEPNELFAPGAAAGASEGAVPVRYRRQVGDYFQRVAEETGEGGH